MVGSAVGQLPPRSSGLFTGTAWIQIVSVFRFMSASLRSYYHQNALYHVSRVMASINCSKQPGMFYQASQISSSFHPFPISKVISTFLGICFSSALLSVPKSVLVFAMVWLCPCHQGETQINLTLVAFSWLLKIANFGGHTDGQCIISLPQTWR
jgi:hypothetical protein